MYLCTVLIQSPNFLILDEPTNDLDVVTLNVLESFLLDFPGNLIVVSHDRYFMDKVVDSLFVFRGDGLVENFPGNYSDFRAYEDSRPVISKKTEKKEIHKKEPQKAKLSYSEKREFGSLENDIEKLERKKKELEAFFTNDTMSEDELQKKSQELQKTINYIEEKEERWLELSMKLEG